MKIAVILLVATCVVFNNVRATPLAGKAPAKPLITQGGEDPDPEVRQKRDFIKQVSCKKIWCHIAPIHFLLTCNHFP